MKAILGLFAILSFSVNSYGQTVDMENVQNVGIKEFMLTSLKPFSPEKKYFLDITAFRNEVFIQQIGISNSINSQISAGESTTKYTQIGNFNNVTVHATVDEIKQDILQKGNNNYLFDFVNNPLQDVSFNLIQNGNNIHVEKYGSNSISNKLELNITGNSKTLIMRNFQ